MERAKAVFLTSEVLPDPSGPKKYIIGIKLQSQTFIQFAQFSSFSRQDR
jgi:hypothetical protein